MWSPPPAMSGSYLPGCSFPSAWSSRGKGPRRLHVPSREQPPLESGTAWHTGLSRGTAPQWLLQVPVGSRL